MPTRLSNPSHVTARSVVRTMPGGTQAQLVKTNAGWYVTKWSNNPQGPYVLPHEAIASELLRRLGVSTPLWAFVEANARFLKEESRAGIHLRNRFEPARMGTHFGSRFPGDPERAVVLDIIPEALLSNLHNTVDFLKGRVVDLWIDNRDPGQAIFFRDRKFGIVGQVIDNGHAFGQEEGRRPRLRDQRLPSRTPLPKAYYETPAAHAIFYETARRIQCIPAAEIEAIIDKLPNEWVIHDHRWFKHLPQRLVRRAQRLTELIDTVLTVGQNERATQLHRSPHDPMKLVFERPEMQPYVR